MKTKDERKTRNRRMNFRLRKVLEHEREREKKEKD